jgi:hypothetical protein
MKKKSLCERLKDVKFSDEYKFNISRCVNKFPGKISGMKSQDCHVFFQCLFLVAIQNFSTLKIQTSNNID